MQELNCKHCGGKLLASDMQCQHCGIPLPPGFAKAKQRRFILWFIIIAIFCAVMIYLLPFFGSSRY